MSNSLIVGLSIWFLITGISYFLDFVYKRPYWHRLNIFGGLISGLVFLILAKLGGL